MVYMYRDWEGGIHPCFFSSMMVVGLGLELGVGLAKILYDQRQ